MIVKCAGMFISSIITDMVKSMINDDIDFRCTVLVGGADSGQMIRDLESGVRYHF